LQQAVGERGFAMIYMGDDTEVADMVGHATFKFSFIGRFKAVTPPCERTKYNRFRKGLRLWKKVISKTLHLLFYTG
jgi:hypothetical protein